ncbi:hypothetical protein [Amycolatopsis sp. CA-126428]|uniref:hypothetical protein n=1 Tax=Amycolatopsis sp. CA-126428 TaxID=2073158 RepID=UPI000CD2BB62|nr:hypothetical protein [Amycolatopsis sp. CA-126428]
MSAAKFQRFSAAAGLRCVAQKLIPWGGTDFTDRISVFRRAAGRSRTTQIRSTAPPPDRPPGSGPPEAEAR